MEMIELKKHSFGPFSRSSCGCRLPWEDPATAFRSAGHVIPPEIAAKKAAAAIAEAQAVADAAQVQPVQLLAV